VYLTNHAIVQSFIGGDVLAMKQDSAGRTERWNKQTEIKAPRRWRAAQRAGARR